MPAEALTLADVFRDAVELPDRPYRKADIGKRRPDVPEGRGWVVVSENGRIARHFHTDGPDYRVTVHLPPWPDVRRYPDDSVSVHTGAIPSEKVGRFTRADLEAVIGPRPPDT